MRLKDEDVGRIFYDGDGAWTVKRKVRNKKKLGSEALQSRG